jgi:hypothetical protein
MQFVCDSAVIDRFGAIPFERYSENAAIVAILVREWGNGVKVTPKVCVKFNSSSGILVG